MVWPLYFDISSEALQQSKIANLPNIDVSVQIKSHRLVESKIHED